MKDKSKVILVVVILIVAALIAYVSYGITKGVKNPLVTMQVSYLDSEGNEKTGTVKMELYPDVAPESVANFIALANNGFYDGLTFHRIVKDFVVQGGDKEGTGSGSASYSDLIETYTITKIEGKKAVCKNNTTSEEKEIKLAKLPKNVKEGDMVWYLDGKYQTNIKDYTYGIKGEFIANNVNNTLKFEKGVLGMARSDYSNYGLTREGYNSASTQFFIVTTNKKSSLNSLNQNYASFGRVIEGYEFIEEIESLYSENNDDENNAKEEENKEEASEENQSEEDANKEDEEKSKVPKMTSVRVETYGANYGLPNAINTEQTMNQLTQIQNNYQSLISSQATDDEDAGLTVEDAE